MEEIRNGSRELFFHDFADDGSEDGLDEPGEPGEFGFAEGVGEVVDVDAHGFEGEDLFQFFLADFDV